MHQIVIEAALFSAYTENSFVRDKQRKETNFPLEQAQGPSVLLKFKKKVYRIQSIGSFQCMLDRTSIQVQDLFEIFL